MEKKTPIFKTDKLEKALKSIKYKIPLQFFLTII